MNKVVIAGLSFALAGCGTVTSLSSTDEEIVHELKGKQTQCESTSRVYGGMSLNLCKMNSNQNNPYINWVLGFYVMDTVACAITDTVALPFTIYRQSEKGSIKIES